MHLVYLWWWIYLKRCQSLAWYVTNKMAAAHKLSKWWKKGPLCHAKWREKSCLYYLYLGALFISCGISSLSFFTKLFLLLSDEFSNKVARLLELVYPLLWLEVEWNKHFGDLIIEKQCSMTSEFVFIFNKQKMSKILSLFRFWSKFLLQMQQKMTSSRKSSFL